MITRSTFSRRSFLAGAAAVGVSAVALACTPVPSKAPSAGEPAAAKPEAAAPSGEVKGTLRVMTELGGTVHDAYMKDIYPQFEEASGFKLEVEVVPWGADLIIKLQTHGAAGTLADVNTDIGSWTRTFIASNMNLDVTDGIDAIGYPYDDVTSPVQGFYELDGKVYGITLELATWNCVYVPELFEQAGLKEPGIGWTHDDMMNAAKALTISEGDKVVQWGMGSNAGQNWTREALLETADAPYVVEEDGQFRVDANNPDAVKLMQDYADLMFVDKVIPTALDFAQMEGGQDAFQAMRYEGKVAIHYTCCGGMRNLDTYGKVDFKFAPLPKFRREGNTGNGTGYFVYSRTKHPLEATQLMCHLTSPEVQEYSNENFGWTPALGSVRKAFFEAYDAKGHNPINYTMLDTLIAQGVPVPSALVPEKGMELQATDGQLMGAVWNGEKTAQEALDEMQKMMEDILARED